ncbi:MAG: 16S rRNA (guanine(527)-N(7))-methyltransferase RsmG, partial [Bacteroidales bacterium]|nr:16S rRNA (guanine(527)-N(7))-methyltransferase RsmG [Bacteroidales bacterium]
MDFEAFSQIVLRLFSDVTPSQMEQFRLMEGLYRDWNSKINVISRKDIDSFYSHHVLHSLAIALYLRREGLDFSGCSVLDLGTGGGFPGIPLAVMYPEARFTLCDSIGKKIKVASSVAQELGLTNVECV